MMRLAVSTMLLMVMSGCAWNDRGSLNTYNGCVKIALLRVINGRVIALIIIMNLRVCPCQGFCVVSVGTN